MNKPLLRQLLVATAPQLAAISVGGIVSFPSVLLHQLQAKDSIISLDIHLKSWLGSTHGLGGLIACFVPMLMQYKGRKLTFMLSCLIGIIGWTIVYFAQSGIVLIVAEMLHGVCGNSMITVSMLSMSEMIHPKFRIASMNMYIVGQALGMSLMILIGQYFHWKTAGLILCCLIIIALLLSLAWPESPEWLAYKGDFDKCEEVFKWLRGTDAETQKELNEMIRAQKVRMSERGNLKLTQTIRRGFLLKITQRDFYLPCLHMFIILCSTYWSGSMVILIYTIDMMQQVTDNQSTAFFGAKIVYIIIFFGNITGTALLKYCNSKTIILSGGTGVVFFMFSSCIISYLQDIKVLPPDSNWCMYCLIGCTVSFNLGAISCVYSLAAELMPVKHRGLGGIFYLISICLLHFSSLKAAPYLFMYMKPWGTFLLYAVNTTLLMLFIWKYVPETKNKTLQEIENYYNVGSFTIGYKSDCDLEKINVSSKVG